MTQQLSLSTLNVATNNNTDKAANSAANTKDNEAFASELDRRINEPQQPNKDKKVKADSKTDTKPAEITAKAEKPDTKDGKKLPPEKMEKSEDQSEIETDKAVNKEIIIDTVDNKAATEGKTGETEEVDPLMILSVTPVTDKNSEKRMAEPVSLIHKMLPQTSETDLNKSVLATQNKSNHTELPATSIRADILQAIQKQGVEGEAVATEKFKSMMQNVVKNPEQMNFASAEAIAAMRQLEPQTERSSVAKPNNPLVFPTIAGTTTSVASVPNVTSPALSLDIQPQLNSAAWAKVMSSRVVWMAREGVQQAELRLNPAHLGPLEVRLSMQNEQTNVTFVASNAAARDALEQALPRLRESFNESGLALNNAEVSHQEQPSNGSDQDEQLSDGNNTAQVIIETDDIDNEAAHLSADSPENSLGVSVFA